MLNFFRRRDTAVRFILGGMLVMICVAMVLFLIPGWGTGANNTPLNQDEVATVDKQPISGLDLNLQLQQQEQGRQLPPQLAPYFAQQILRNMILRVALADQAQKMGLVATNAEVVQAAQQQNPELFPNGHYVGDQQAAPEISQVYQKTVPQYEDMLRQEVLDQKLYDLVTDGVSVDDAALQKEFLNENEKAQFDYVLFKPTDLLSQVTVTPAGLEAYFKQNASKYMQPERRRLEVVLANEDALASQIQVTEAQIEQNYQQNIANYTHPERVQIAHILLKITPGESPADVAKTKAQAEALDKQIKAGANFADLAKKNSQDDASASKGGELGWIERGQTAPAVEQAAFSTPPGQVTDVIQTDYGFEIIKVEAHDPAHTQPLSEVHDQIKQQMQQALAADRAQSLIDQAQALASSTPLEQVAKQLNLTYFTTAPLTRTDPVEGIGLNQDFANAVFSVSPGGITPPVQVATGFAFARVNQVLPPTQETLDQARDAVTADYKQQLADALAKSKANELAAAAQKQGLKAAAAAQHDTLKTSDAVTRTATVGDVGSISSFADTLFSLKPGAVGPPTAVGDNQLVYSLVSLQEPTAAQFAQQRATLLDSMLQQQRSAVFQSFADNLFDTWSRSGRIRINAAAIDRAVGNGSGSAGGL